MNSRHLFHIIPGGGHSSTDHPHNVQQSSSVGTAPIPSTSPKSGHARSLRSKLAAPYWRTAGPSCPKREAFVKASRNDQHLELLHQDGASQGVLISEVVAVTT